ncbi:hypothetical protein CW751_10435 [Brumimicrobium salinarum]|uniref:Uncharacterized protein n=1 Tax=Brumimicrobium salinarum TaxID=2058658 RepID=A0A2I0R107_9FLAO|nr:hypothetical protein [Brumimicrobium salinarum]PKR80263.1 hypothetical protein CW751_10435 [Brumimicrobium salinarum]
MHKYDKKEFRSLSLPKRYRVVQEEGEYIGVRQLGDHRVHLYAVCGFYVELWILFSIQQIHWIEIQENQSIINEYGSNINVRKDLGLD